ncbi:MAG: Holliday junction resolvase RuvX [Candidatus Moraniibacteriota bacterium]
MTETIQQENFLGIDWGLRDIGIALAHAETRIAIPFMTESNDDGFLDRIGQLIVAEHIGTTVIGIPSHINRKEVEYPGEILGRRLSERFGVRVAYQDEMFTTKLAQQALIQRGERHVGKHDDAEAACIILQQWLDRKPARSGVVASVEGDSQ